LPIVAWIVARGAGAEFAWTMLEYPRLALAQVEPQNVRTLLGALRWLAVSVALMVPAAALFVVGALRAPTSRAGLLAVASIGWIASGLVMFLTQRFSCGTRTWTWSSGRSA
jgi:hypothetical protein